MNQKVLFKISDLKPPALVGEKQMAFMEPYPVRVVASKPNTLIFIMNRRNFMNIFSSKKEQEKLLDLMSTVTFPNHEEVIRDIYILKEVHQIKKNAFMNACDTNFVAKDMRDEIIDDPKTLKKVKWVQDIDEKIQERMNKRIKIIK